MRTKRCRPGSNHFWEKIRNNNKLSSVELAMGQLIQLYSVCVGEFLVCMQFNAKKKKSDPDLMLYSVSSAELAEKVVKVKLGQIHLNEVFVGEFYNR